MKRLIPRRALAIGVDIVELDRIRLMFEQHRSRFLEIVYTPHEQQLWGRCPIKLAGVFAAKEAAAKALGLGLSYMAPGGAGLHELEITALDGDLQRPHLCLYGGAQARAAARGLHCWSLSIAHSRTTAVAFVVASACDRTA